MSRVGSFISGAERGETEAITPTSHPPLWTFERSTFWSRVGLGFWVAVMVAGLYYWTQSEIGMWVALCGLTGIVYCVYVAYVVGRKSVEVYEDGLVMHDKSGSHSYSWSDVQQYTFRITRMYQMFIPTGTIYKATLRTSDGATYVVDNTFKRAGKFIEIVSDLIFEPLLERTLARIRAGETVSFGKISLNQTGLNKGSQTVPWSELEGATLESGEIVVLKRRPGYDLKKKPLRLHSQLVEVTPNALVLVEVVKRFSAGSVS